MLHDKNTLARESDINLKTKPEDELSQAIRRVLPPPKFELIFQHSTDRPTDTELQRIKDLKKILSYVNSFSVGRPVLTPHNDRDVMQLISLYVFRPHESNLNHCDATRAPLTLTSFNELKKVHAILHEVLLSHPRVVKQLVNKAFIHKLVNQLATPVSSERKYIEKEISLITSTVEDGPSHVFKCLLDSISECIHENSTTTGLSSILRLLSPLLHVRMSNQTYRHFIVPLYRLRAHPSYARELRALTLFFGEWSISNAVYCLDYLLRHWPIANSRKEILFLHELFALLRLMSENRVRADRRVCARLARWIAHCLASKHAEVAETTARLLQRTGERASLLLQSKGAVPRALAAALESAKAHWHEAVRNAAAALAPIVQKKHKADAHGRSDAARRELWNRVIKRAHPKARANSG
jgi:serine/threonine-protein phosphatase 2A regulatory subunit B'